MDRKVSLSLLAAFSLGGSTAWAQSWVVTRVKVEGMLVLRADPERAPVPISEEYDPKTGRGPFLALWPGSDTEGILGSSDPESFLSKRFGLPLPPIEGLDAALGFTQPQDKTEFWGVNIGGGLVSDSYYVNGWLRLSGAEWIFYIGNVTNPFLSAAASDPGEPPDSIEWQAALYSWDFIDDKVAGNGNNRACSPPREKGPGGKFFVLVERSDCLFAPKVQNAALAGAAGVVIYDSTASEVFPGPILTPGASIPSVLVRRADGLALLQGIAAQGEGKATLTWRPANLMGTLGGSIAGDELKLTLVMTEAWDHMFVGTVTGRLPAQAGVQALSFPMARPGRVPERRSRARAKPLIE